MKYSFSTMFFGFNEKSTNYQNYYFRITSQSSRGPVHITTSVGGGGSPVLLHLVHDLSGSECKCLCEMTTSYYVEIGIRYLEKCFKNSWLENFWKNLSMPQVSVYYNVGNKLLTICDKSKFSNFIRFSISVCCFTVLAPILVPLCPRWVQLYFTLHCSCYLAILFGDEK